MPERTVKGQRFSIVINGQRIVVAHVQSKGKRCRVTLPAGAFIEMDKPPSDSCRDEGGMSRTN